MRRRCALPLLALLLRNAIAYVSDGNSFGWRMPCAAFPNIERLDPIMAPGVASNHAHMFFGSSRFHSNLTYEDLRAADCSSCRMAEDKSAYWVPPLYFKYTNGTIRSVPMFGGILVYYNRLDDEYEPFPAGFRMIAGDMSRRNTTIADQDPWETSRWTAADMTEEVARERAIGFLCLNYDKNVPNEMAFARHSMPSREFLAAYCPHGLRAELAFPSCWNGKDIDSLNHRDHMAYDRFVHKGGPCPSTHPIRLPSLLFETIYDTYEIAKQDGEFVWAQGDTSGYGYHADFMNGWDPSFLKLAMEQCKNDVGDVENLPCHIMTKQDGSKCVAEKYKPLEVLSREVCYGFIDEFCGSKEPGWNTTAATCGGLEPAAVVAESPIVVPMPSDYHCNMLTMPYSRPLSWEQSYLAV